MKLSKNFLVHKTDNETVLVPTSKAKFSGIIRGNKTLGAIIELLINETTEEEIIQNMKSKFDAPEEKIARDVHTAISKLNKIGAIDE